MNLFRYAKYFEANMNEGESSFSKRENYYQVEHY